MSRSVRYRARGASTVEFVVVAPVLALMGLGTVQAGLAYHGKTVLNYATFEAARTGATHHALSGPMRRELAARLAPVIGGDGSDAAAAGAIGTSLTAVSVNPLDAAFTRVRVLNPSTEAFDHFSVRSRESGRDAIPNSHLRFRAAAAAAGTDPAAGIDPVSGVDLRDANLLRIEVTYGFDLKVPLIGALAAPLLTLYDPAHAHYHAAGKLPLTSVATVRMQSEVWRDSLVSMNAVPPGGADVPGESAADPDAVAGSSTPDDGGGGRDDGAGGTGGTCDDSNGLAMSIPILTSGEGQCAPGTAFPGGPFAGGDEELPNSPACS